MPPSFAEAPPLSDDEPVPPEDSTDDDEAPADDDGPACEDATDAALEEGGALEEGRSPDEAGALDDVAALDDALSIDEAEALDDALSIDEAEALDDDDSDALDDGALKEDEAPLESADREPDPASADEEEDEEDEEAVVLLAAWPLEPVAIPDDDPNATPSPQRPLVHCWSPGQSAAELHGVKQPSASRTVPSGQRTHATCVNQATAMTNIPMSRLAPRVAMPPRIRHDSRTRERLFTWMTDSPRRIQGYDSRRIRVAHANFNRFRCWWG